MLKRRLTEVVVAKLMEDSHQSSSDVDDLETSILAQYTRRDLASQLDHHSPGMHFIKGESVCTSY